MQCDISAAAGFVDRLHRKIALAARLPTHRPIGRKPGTARNDRHFIGDDEGRIKADAELPDQMRVLGLIASQRGKEFARTGLGDGTKLIDRIFARQPDTVVRNGERARFLVESDTNFQLGVVAVQRRIVQGLETQFVARVGGVRNQLTQKNFLVAVQRMNHQLKQLLDLGLKAECFLGITHARTP